MVGNFVGGISARNVWTDTLTIAREALELVEPVCRRVPRLARISESARSREGDVAKYQMIIIGQKNVLVF